MNNKKFDLNDFLEMVDDKSKIRQLDYALHREDVLNVIKVLIKMDVKDEDYKYLVMKTFGKCLNSDFINDGEILINLLTISRDVVFDLNKAIENKDFITNFFNELAEPIDIKTLKVSDNVEIVSKMLDKYGFSVLQYVSSDCYKNNEFAKKVLLFAERNNWIDEKHDFIKSREFVFLYENKFLKKLDKTFNKKDALVYTTSKCVDFLNNLIIEVAKHEMENDRKKIIEKPTPKLKKF